MGWLKALGWETSGERFARELEAQKHNVKVKLGEDFSLVVGATGVACERCGGLVAARSEWTQRHREWCTSVKRSAAPTSPNR
jgi:hypothetical protein